MSLSKPLAPELISGATTLPQRIFSKVITTFLPLVGERWTWAIMHVIYHETVWSLYVYPLLLAEKYGWMEKWRIQKGKYPDPELVKRMYKDVAFGKLMSPLVIAFVMYPLFKFGGADLAQAIRKYPDWPEFLKGIAICFVGEDFFFYWTHRALHSKYLYRFHKQHHMFKQPTAAMYDWAHPVEAIGSVLFSVMVTPALLKVHPYTFYVYILVRVSEAIYSHSGFDIPWFPFNWFPTIMGGADRHDFHHSKNVGMYGSLTKVWDWLCGTDKTYWAFKERQKKGLADTLADDVDVE